jgi:hypothetical protein
MKQTARKRHKHKNMSIKRHVKKRNTRKLYKTKASGKNVKLEWYEKFLQRWIPKLALTEIEIQGAQRRAVDPKQTKTYRERQKAIIELLNEKLYRYTHAINVIRWFIGQEKEKAATRIQSSARSKTAKYRVRLIKEDIEVNKLLKAIAASKKAAASAITSADAAANATTSADAAANATTSAVITSKSPLVKPPKTSKTDKEMRQTRMDAIFTIIKNKLANGNGETEKISPGNRLDETGRTVLYLTLKRYINKIITGNSNTDQHQFDRKTFEDTLDLNDEKMFIKQYIGKSNDPVTYINFNINILCPESKPQLPTVPVGQPYWEAHITLLDDDEMKKTHGDDVYKFSHLTFTKWAKGAKIKNLHVYQDKADINLMPDLPIEISRPRLTIFRDLVFSFITHHPTQLKEMVQEKYVKAQKPEQAASNLALGLSATPRKSRGQSYTRSGSRPTLVTRVNKGGRKFTLKISSHRTRYNKRKHKTINSTQKNKRRK